ncbi:MAG: ABC transporter ATP-binding protein [Defluviitaleaceae bacterium]|nr:ABC transporter ATP-binding protein [Defluviitaleaceae bacterium]
MITATGITKSYGGKVVLDGVDFSAASGDSAVIVGRNGAGKSTLLSIMAGHLQPEAGTVAICDADGRSTYAAYCPQEDNLFDELTVRDNLLFWARARGVGSDTSEGLATLFGIDMYAHKRISQLSGGMKKSVAIMCSLTGNSPVLILDEPFSGLDILYKRELLQALGSLKDMGKCVIYTSHSTDEIVGLDSAIYTLANSKLTFVGTRKEFSLESIIV